jgi:hypothetical protein
MAILQTTPRADNWDAILRPVARIVPEFGPASGAPHLFTVAAASPQLLDAAQAFAALIGTTAVREPEEIPACKWSTRSPRSVALIVIESVTLSSDSGVIVLSKRCRHPAWYLRRPFHEVQRFELLLRNGQWRVGSYDRGEPRPALQIALWLTAAVCLVALYSLGATAIAYRAPRFLRAFGLVVAFVVLAGLLGLSLTDPEKMVWRENAFFRYFAPEVVASALLVFPSVIAATTVTRNYAAVRREPLVSWLLASVVSGGVLLLSATVAFVFLITVSGEL